MRNPDAWIPSKVVLDARKQLRANERHVARGSRLAVDILAPQYESLLREHARGRLLDCGCGDVPYYGVYKAHVSETTCIDWGQSAHQCVHLDAEVDLNGALPFADASFDTVLLADVLEHIASPARLLGEIARVLSPGGALIVMVPFLYRVHEEPHDYYRYTQFGLEALVRETGLTTEVLTPLGGYPDVLLDMISKGLADWSLPSSLLYWCSSWAVRARSYQAWRARTASRFPLAYGLVARKPHALSAGSAQSTTNAE